jgi:hypothetical protein
MVCQRDWSSVITGGAQDRRRLDHGGRFLGENVRIPCLLDRVPQRLGPTSLFGDLQHARMTRSPKSRIALS